MERITTRHPDPSKEGTNIELVKYEEVRRAIREILDEQGELSFTELTEEVKDRIENRFDGSIPWYVTTVKLDMEARGEILCDRTAKRQLIRQAT